MLAEQAFLTLRPNKRLPSQVVQVSIQQALIPVLALPIQHRIKW